jgi:N-acetylglutamate synthase-like GNAT family acetyltransferase
MNIELRRAVLGDAPVLSELIVRSKRSNGYDDEFMRACKDDLAITPTHMARGQYWVAQNETELCGCICLVVDKSSTTADVEAGFVEPRYKRQGVGRMLWERLCEVAVSEGVATLRLDADPAAVPFYKSLQSCFAHGYFRPNSYKFHPRLRCRLEPR